ncbi:MAG: selenide, water dikinase SelD [Candidatus Cloacimonetes bacterium]|nr:selenide, water dikinase SelD [Candidatus Cloacimonadota bacterium]
MKPIYLDFNATTPLAEEVMDLMKEAMQEDFGNPSSTHYYGLHAKERVEKAREHVARLIGCYNDEIIFTSGGTEANNLAIQGIVYAHRRKGNHIITSQIEHPAVMEVCRHLEEGNFRITYLPVDENGIVILDALREAITPETILITIMHSNNETGSLQPIAEIGEIAEKHKIIFHTDAAQSAGKVELDVKELKVNLLSLAGHKFYAPKGVGALFIKRGTEIVKTMHGAEHERHLRPGTENVVAITGIGKAAEIAFRDLEKNSSRMREMRDSLQQSITPKLAKAGIDQKLIKLNGHDELRLPNTLNLSFYRVDAGTLLSVIGDQIALSAGAACHSDRIEVSYVLEAMKVPVDFAMGTIRFSTGRNTTKDEIDRAAEIMIKNLQPLMTQSSEPIIIAEEQEEIKLTKYTHGLGCACKIQPSVLEKVLRELPVLNDPNVLVGPESSDDAAIYKLDEERALVLTTDFFTPIVDEPFHFGAIAAANALSDIYAMGANPLFALNIVGFPINRLPVSVLSDILKGAASKTNEAGIPILGGHTIEDPEPKYGLVVAGIVEIDKILTNKDAQEGDVLILTKPIGTGIITTAMKRGIASEEQKRSAIENMSSLNKQAAEILRQYEIHSCTDVTGFGLLGHLSEMTRGSEMNAEIYLEKVPQLPGLRELLSRNSLPGGTTNNKNHYENFVKFASTISETEKLILFDAQTSGGLLVALPSKMTEQAIDACQKAGINSAAIIGKITSKGTGEITVK